jgi:hypothetical protein
MQNVKLLLAVRVYLRERITEGLCARRNITYHGFLRIKWIRQTRHDAFCFRKSPRRHLWRRLRLFDTSESCTDFRPWDRRSSCSHAKRFGVWLLCIKLHAFPAAKSLTHTFCITCFVSQHWKEHNQFMGCVASRAPEIHHNRPMSLPPVCPAYIQCQNINDLTCVVLYPFMSTSLKNLCRDCYVFAKCSESLQVASWSPTAHLCALLEKQQQAQSMSKKIWIDREVAKTQGPIEDYETIFRIFAVCQFVDGRFGV